jgi:hypothetical protein
MLREIFCIETCEVAKYFASLQSAYQAGHMPAKFYAKTGDACTLITGSIGQGWVLEGGGSCPENCLIAAGVTVSMLVEAITPRT